MFWMPPSQNMSCIPLCSPCLNIYSSHLYHRCIGKSSHVTMWTVVAHSKLSQPTLLSCLVLLPQQLSCKCTPFCAEGPWMSKYFSKTVFMGCITAIVSVPGRARSANWNFNSFPPSQFLFSCFKTNWWTFTLLSFSRAITESEEDAVQKRNYCLWNHDVQSTEALCTNLDFYDGFHLIHFLEDTHKAPIL